MTKTKQLPIQFQCHQYDEIFAYLFVYCSNFCLHVFFFNLFSLKLNKIFFCSNKVFFLSFLLAKTWKHSWLYVKRLKKINNFRFMRISGLLKGIQNRVVWQTNKINYSTCEWHRAELLLLFYIFAVTESTLSIKPKKNRAVIFNHFMKSC